jgi:hypothetical protein
MNSARALRLMIGVLAAAAGLGSAQGASAQLATGRSGSSTMQYLQAEEAMAGLMRFGRCYARDHTEKALRLLNTPPSSREEAETFDELFRRSNEICLGNITTMTTIPTFIRGAIAEGMYVRGIAVPEEMRWTAPDRAHVGGLSDATRCYVATHADEVRVFLADTKAGTRHEYEELQKLLPTLVEECVPEGAPFNFDAITIRLRLAEAMLRIIGPAEQVN